MSAIPPKHEIPPKNHADRHVFHCVCSHQGVIGDSPLSTRCTLAQSLKHSNIDSPTNIHLPTCLLTHSYTDSLTHILSFTNSHLTVSHTLSLTRNPLVSRGGGSSQDGPQAGEMFDVHMYYNIRGSSSGSECSTRRTPYPPPPRSRLIGPAFTGLIYRYVQVQISLV